MEIMTNNIPRPVISEWELTAKERAAFDYAIDGCSFFRYKGAVYAMCEFVRAPGVLQEWDGVMSDSFFSGIVVKIVNAGESVIVGRYYS